MVIKKFNKFKTYLPELLLVFISLLILMTLYFAIYEGIGIKDDVSYRSDAYSNKILINDLNNSKNTLESDTYSSKSNNKSFCNETDGGLNLFVRGKITSSNIGEGEDYCIQNKTLIEYFCDNETSFKKIFDCPNYCKNGACFDDNSEKSDCIIKNVFHERKEDKINNFLFIQVDGFLTNDSLYLSGTKTEFDGGEVIFKNNSYNYQILMLNVSLSALDASILLNSLDNLYLIRGTETYCTWPKEDKK